jgi:hypothetical protein
MIAMQNPNRREWSKVLQMVEMNGISSMDPDLLNGLVQDMDEKRRQDHCILDRRRQVHFENQKKQREFLERTRSDKIAQSSRELENQKAIRLLRMETWFEKLKERDKNRAREKKALRDLLVDPMQTMKAHDSVSAESSRNAGSQKGTRWIPKTERKSSLEDVPGPVTPPMTSRTALSLFSRFSSPPKAKPARELDPYLQAMNHSKYARSTNLASHVYSKGRKARK